MPKVERIGTKEDAVGPLRVTRRAERQVSAQKFVRPQIRVRCGCCKEAVTICHEGSHAQAGTHLDTLEINGVIGTISQWRKVLLPLLGLQERRAVSGGVLEVEWRSRFSGE